MGVGLMRLRNDFIGPAGDTITAANSGDVLNNAFDVVQAPPAGGTNVFTTAGARYPGAFAGEIQIGATAGTTYWRWSTALGTPSQVWGRVYATLSAPPASNTRIFSFNSGATLCAAVTYRTTGNLALRNSAASDTVIMTGATPTATRIRIEWRMQFSTTTGNADLWRYDNPEAPIGAHSELISSSAQNYGAATADQTTLGWIASTSNIGPWRLDGWEVTDVAPPGGQIGPGPLVACMPGRFVPSLRAANW